MPKLIYCATSNLDKLREFRLALAGLYQVEQVPHLKDLPQPEETGSTFAENAAIKALYYSNNFPEPVFADDSGIEVDALNGEPGVRSARYSGENATNESNNQLLLQRMRDVPDRAARFVCVIALAEKGKLIREFRGAVEGELLDAPRGTHGFGYDPLFYFPPFGCSFGEATDEQKNLVSHRAQALRQMVAYLEQKSIQRPESY